MLFIFGCFIFIFINTDIIERLIQNHYPAFRPMIHFDAQLEDLIAIARLAWDEATAFRPNFQAITEMLKNLSGGQ